MTLAVTITVMVSHVQQTTITVHNFIISDHEICLYCTLTFTYNTPWLSRRLSRSINESMNWLLVKVLHPTQHKIGHFGDVPQANLLAWYGKTKPNTTKTHILESDVMYYNTK